MQRFDPRHSGMTLPELLLVVLLLGLMAAVSSAGVGRSLARTRVEAAARQLAVGLEQARSAAEASGSPCALLLGERGWSEPTAAEVTTELAPCVISERRLPLGLQLSHNLPSALRISSNGLVLDGGTVVIGAAGTDLRRCLVVSLPLGVVRIGRSAAAVGAPPRSNACVVDPSL